MQENPKAGNIFGQMIKNQPAEADLPENLVALRKEALERMDPQSIVRFYKANWPVSPVTMETTGFGFKFGEFPPVKAPTLFIYGKKNSIFLGENLNGMWDWVEGPLTIQTIPGAGHAVHTEAPEVVTSTMMRWFESIE